MISLFPVAEARGRLNGLARLHGLHQRAPCTSRHRPPRCGRMAAVVPHGRAFFPQARGPGVSESPRMSTAVDAPVKGGDGLARVEAAVLRCLQKSHRERSSTVTSRARSALAAAALAAAVALSPAARAEPPGKVDRAAASALFDEGRALMAAGKHAEACPKLAESQRLDPSISTLFDLSDCHERTGRTATAWLGFRDVAVQALAAGQLDREKEARQRAANLEPRLSRLRIVVGPGVAVEGLQVTRDGAAVGEALWGTPVPVDPGAHTVRATAPAGRRWETTVRLDQPGLITVEVPPLAPGDASPSPAPAGAAPGPAPAPAGPTTQPGGPASPAPARPGPPPSAPASEQGAWRSPVGSVAMGVGAAALGVGTVIAFVAKSTFDDSNEGGHCDEDGRCDDEGLALRGDAITQGEVATVISVAGLVFAVGGAILWLSTPSEGQRNLTGPTPAQLAVGAGPGNVVLRGVF